jgi:AhpD family alkylhydroperoxidase
VARLSPAAGDGAVAARIRARRGGALRPIDAMLLHSPPVADGWNALLGAVRDRMALAPALRELVVLRVAVLNGTPYEWEAHQAPARAAGIDAAAMAALRSGAAPTAAEFDGTQQLVLAYTDAMTTAVEVADELFEALRTRFGEETIVELTACVAVYNMVSRFVTALRVGEPPAAGGPAGPGAVRQ